MAQQLAKRIKKLFSKQIAKMKRVLAIYCNQPNKSWTFGTELQLGGHVWMDARNQLKLWPSEKLDWKDKRPSKDTEVISSWAYWIISPVRLQIHHVQPISPLKKAAQDSQPLEKWETPPLVIVEEEEENKVKWVDNCRLFQRQLQYLVNWRGYNVRKLEPTTDVDGLKAIDNMHTE
jgi:hypothetical protein